jgi:FkbH-like protein
VSWWNLSKPNADNGPGYLSMLEAVQEHARTAAWPRLRWAMLSNTTQEPLRPFLKQLCYDIGFEADVWIGGYDTALQDASLSECSGADAVVIALRLQLVAPALVDSFVALTADAVRAEAQRALDYVSAVVTAVRERSKALIFVHNFETPLYPELGAIDYRSGSGQVNTIRRLNLDLAERLSHDDNVFIVDLDALRGRLAGDRFTDPRTWHIGRVAYTRAAMRAIAAEYVKVVRAAKGRNRKCIVVDADGTLWGGIVGEDGIDCVKVGRSFPGSAFHEFQQALLALRARGILLALCSKNDPEIVTALFAARAADMALRLDHFASVRVNWADKAQNIREIAAELNIGLDSLVFVDDNPFETALVQQLLPMVHTIQLPADPVEYRDILARCDLFDALTFSDEDRRRSDMYASEQRRRVEQQSSSMSVAEYLQGLDMEATIDRVDERTIARVAQLTQKTNQFNLTTRRYTESDIRGFAASSDHDVYTARLRDRLGDSGIVGVAIVRHETGRSHIDTLLMSCRVLGRGVEDALLGACLEASGTRGSAEVIGQFIPTGKNARVSDFYQTHGFAADDAGAFHRSIANAAVEYPAHFKSVVVDGEHVSR